METATSRSEKVTGGSTRTHTTYTYKQGWSAHLQNSRTFKQHPPHIPHNPDTKRIESTELRASQVWIGAFKLDCGLPDAISEAFRDYQLSEEHILALPPDKRQESAIIRGGMYVGRSPHAPQIGDLLVHFKVARAPTTASVIAKQQDGPDGPMLVAVRTGSGSTVALGAPGVVEPGVLVQRAEAANNTLTWVLRAVGYILVCFAVSLSLEPIGTIADVLPIAGAVVRMGTGFVSVLLGCALSSVVMALAWLFYRPMFSLVLFASAAIAMYFLTSA